MSAMLLSSETTLIRSVAEEIRTALRTGAVGRMLVPPRQTVTDRAGVKYISMPAVSADYDLYINKTATIVPAGAATVTSVVTMFSTATGRYLGLLDGARVTNLKCAAVTALVTDRCAVPDAAVLGIIGAGVQARQQFLAVTAVRDIAEVRVHSRRRGRAEAFARQIAASGYDVRVCDTAEQASRGVDVLSTATTSAEPLPLSAELPAHLHVNCFGGHTVESRELSAELLASSLLIVEDRATAVAEAGPLHAAAIELDALEQRADLTSRRTVFASTGCAYLDLITAACLGMSEDGPDGSAHIWEAVGNG